MNFSEFSHEQMMMTLVVCSPVVWNSGGISAEGDAILLGIPKNSKPLGPQSTFSTKRRLIPMWIKYFRHDIGDASTQVYPEEDGAMWLKFVGENIS